MNFSKLVRRLREPQLIGRRATVRERGYCFAWEVWAYAALDPVVRLDDTDELDGDETRAAAAGRVGDR